jgi:hypothetical protein
VYILEPEVVNVDNENAYMCFFTRRVPEQEMAVEARAKKQNTNEMPEEEEEEEEKRKAGAKLRKYRRTGRNFKIRRQTFSQPQNWPSPFAALPAAIQTGILETGGTDRGAADTGVFAANTLQKMHEEVEVERKRTQTALLRITEEVEEEEEAEAAAAAAGGGTEGEGGAGAETSGAETSGAETSGAETSGAETGGETDLEDSDFYADGSDDGATAEVPAGPPMPDGWQAVPNPNSTWEGDAFYFHNVDTDEVSWTRPSAGPVFL